jgi:hypothetical protein
MCSGILNKYMFNVRSAAPESAGLHRLPDDPVSRDAAPTDCGGTDRRASARSGWQAINPPVTSVTVAAPVISRYNHVFNRDFPCKKGVTKGVPYRCRTSQQPKEISIGGRSDAAI